MPPATHGRFHCNELITRNVDEAKAFYAKTLGWTYESPRCRKASIPCARPAGRRSQG